MKNEPLYLLQVLALLNAMLCACSIAEGYTWHAHTLQYFEK